MNAHDEWMVVLAATKEGGLIHEFHWTLMVETGPMFRVERGPFNNIVLDSNGLPVRDIVEFITILRRAELYDAQKVLMTADQWGYRPSLDEAMRRLWIAQLPVAILEHLVSEPIDELKISSNDLARYGNRLQRMQTWKVLFSIPRLTLESGGSATFAHDVVAIAGIMEDRTIHLDHIGGLDYLIMDDEQSTVIALSSGSGVVLYVDDTLSSVAISRLLLQNEVPYCIVVPDIRENEQILDLMSDHARAMRRAAIE